MSALVPGPETAIGAIAGTNDAPGREAVKLLLTVACQAYHVRALQNRFYRERSSMDEGTRRDLLAQCKAAERELDKLLSTPAQLSLGIDHLPDTNHG